ARGCSAEVIGEEGTLRRWEGTDPLDALRDVLAGYQAVPDPELPRFFGGAVGYISYDWISQVERRVPLSRGEGLGWPDMVFMIADTLVIFDHVRHTIRIVADAHVQGDPDRAYDQAAERIEGVYRQLTSPVSYRLAEAPTRPQVDVHFRSNMEPQQFKAAVQRVREYISAGDVIQVVLSQRFEAPGNVDPLSAYRALRSLNPSPYMFFLELGERSMVGSSPEVHVRCEEGNVEIRPIAGTRPRAEDPAEDERLAAELLADPKERAEHIMLVDLARNDIGRVCSYGSVRVPELMVIERYSHVMHIVSDVVGRLAPAKDMFDVMRATFPAGTVSGAPKIRAMQIIAELETVRRGPYAGAVGYFSFNGNLDSCITIRTILFDRGTAYVQAGAGIVADSDPEREYEETCNKARGMLKALEIARSWKSHGGDPR
ncbi:MAG TPA: anthranilate synthase component I, partial [Lentisphaerae bacterium]|nr:anthranilate synthase component I [Lentisphaerota bacterium]